MSGSLLVFTRTFLSQRLELDWDEVMISPFRYAP